MKRDTKEEYRHLCLPTPQQCEEMKQEYTIINEKWIELDDKYNNEELEQKLLGNDSNQNQVKGYTNI